MSDDIVNSAIPFAAFLAPVLSGALRVALGFLVRFLGSWAMMAVFALVAELLPRLLGLGQGLISWGAGAFASAAFSAFRSAFDIVGITLPSFIELLSDLPPGLLWAGSALRVHKVVGILVSIPLVKLARKVLEHLALSVGNSAGAAGLMGGKR